MTDRRVNYGELLAKYMGIFDKETYYYGKNVVNEKR